MREANKKEEIRKKEGRRCYLRRQFVVCLWVLLVLVSSVQPLGRGGCGVLSQWWPLYLLCPSLSLEERRKNKNKRKKKKLAKDRRQRKDKTVGDKKV